MPAKTSTLLNRSLRWAAALLVLTVTAAAPCLAADVYLVARPTTITMPDATVIDMWGFAVDDDGNLNTIGSEIPTIPGPMITVPDTESTLNIHVRNDLTEPISIVIPGLPASFAPVTFTDTEGRVRVKSFAKATAASGGIETYTWTSVSAGTYFYQSGYHSAVQVPMGLYGAVKKDAAPGMAYSGNPNVDASYANEVVLIYSEIDPALNAAVAGGTYGTPAYPGVINYRARYFLVNGEPYSGQPPLPAGSVGDRILVRFLNAGLNTHVPLFQGMLCDLIAEDGNVYPYARRQYSLRLPAGKTRDAIVVPAAAGIYAVYDRRLCLTDNDVSGGGMVTHLEVTP